MPTRRQLLMGLSALSASAALPRLSLASTGSEQRLVVIILRGGLDGLALLPPHGDPHYRSARGKVALPMPGSSGGILDLDGFFGLHPALESLLPMYRSGDLLGVHAVGHPNTQRSHFEAQDMLEGGGASARVLKTGWLNRALSCQSKTDASQAIAIGQGLRTLTLLTELILNFSANRVVREGAVALGKALEGLTALKVQVFFILRI